MLTLHEQEGPRQRLPFRPELRFRLVDFDHFTVVIDLRVE